MQHPAQWTPKSLLDWSEGYFRERAIPTPRLDAELLLAHVLGCRRIDLYLQFDRPLTESELAAYRALVQGRARRTPVAYLVGEAEFYGLTLAVGPGCLIPRQDTETLVDVALEAVQALRAGAPAAGAPLTVLEWGTGSAAIPLALCAAAEGLRLFCCDLSPEALAWARRNRERHAALLAPRGNALHLVRCAGFGAIRPEARPALILANPPYVPAGTIPGLEPEVAEAEPRLALDGGADGLDAYRALLPFAAAQLAPGGRLVVECGFDQGEALRELVAAHPPLRLLEVRWDLAGHERVIHAERADGAASGT